MNKLNIGDNIIRLRHKKQITQEQLSDFIGVTKASVSKWETGQSTPDIILLPRLATYFDITVDELLGYEPQLSKEQIEKIYRELAVDFAENTFEDTMHKSRELVKQYYSCYLFLFQIGVLWLNHVSLAKSKEEQTEIMKSISDLCDHIISGSQDLGVCSNAVVLKSYVNLQLGNVLDVIDDLEDTLNPEKLVNQSDGVLIQAYVLAGDLQKAACFTQISMYSHLLSLIGSARMRIAIHSDDPSMCEKTISRMEKIMEIFEIEMLQPNAASQFHYQAALIYSAGGEKQKAVEQLKKCSLCLMNLLSQKEITFHGDDYFNLIELWFKTSGLNINAPRDRKLVVEDIKHLYDNPAFAMLEDEPDFQKLKKELMGVQ